MLGLLGLVKNALAIIFLVVFKVLDLKNLFILFASLLTLYNYCITKESLFQVPFIGWCLSLTKHIRLSRGKFGSIKQVYREAAYWLRNGMSVVFFPEGGRSKTGKIGKFQNGAFKLAIREKKPILPIVINGTREAIPKGSWFFRTNVKAKLTILPPVETEDFQPGDFVSLKDTVHARLESLIA